jgi:hypothetical protein
VLAALVARAQALSATAQQRSADVLPGGDTLLPVLTVDHPLKEI